MTEVIYKGLSVISGDSEGVCSCNQKRTSVI